MNVFDLVAKISLDSSQYESGLKTAGGKMQAAGKRMSVFGATMTKRVTMPIVAIGAASIKAFNDVKKGLNIVTQKTGATGQALADMHQSVKTLSTEIPASFEEIGTAVGEVNTRFNITGQELEDLSGQFVKFAKVNGTDVNNSIDTTQKALAAFGLEAKDAEGLLDTMTRVGQNTGVSMETLMNGLVQNGTAFQQLGLSIEQSVGLMGQLDKSGANSETVMMGLRRALKNAAKEGVPLDKALGDLQKSILDGKDGMDGLNTAYELFGRSGDQIYGAVKNGTIDFTKLGDAAEDASGVLDRTFEATLTPAEKFQRTLNSMKVTGYEFGNTALSMLAPALEKLSKKAKDLSEKWQNMDGHSKEMVIKFAAIAAAAGPAISIIGKFATVIGTIASSAPLSIAAVVGLSGALIAYSASARKAKIEENALDEEEEKTVKTLTDATKAYEEADKARKEATSTAMSEAEYAHSLVDEYNSLIGANGEVKEGYQDRADYIKGELASALGIEKSAVDDLIGKNGQLKNSVNELIEAKKNEAILDANKDAYAQAIKEQQGATENLGKALREKAAQEAEYAQAQQEYQRAEEQYHNNSGKFAAQYQQRMNKAKDAMDAAELGIKKQDEAIQGYQETLSKTSTEITNYEGLANAIASKDTEAIQKWSAALTSGIKTRENATRQELVDQAKAVEEEYELIKKAYEDGEEGVTEQMVEDAKKRSDAAKKEIGMTDEVTAAMQKDTAKKLKKMSGDAAREGNKTKSNLLNALATMASKGGGSFDKIESDANTKLKKVKKHAENAASGTKGVFPINVGKTLAGTLISIFTKKKGKDTIQTKQETKFAKAYETPWLFTQPTSLVGDRGATQGGEILYGRNKLMSDVADAVQQVSAGDININLYYTASDDANDMVKDIARAVRRCRMAGVI